MAIGAWRVARAALLAICAAGALAPAAPASGAVSIDAASSTFTGAAFTATANASDPGSVVLYEWDFDGDGSFDYNSTASPQAQFVYAVAKPDHIVRVNVTRLAGSNLTVEAAALQVRVEDGAPSVALDLPDRLVSGVDITFVARASDPDPSPRGEPFAYRWSVDGVEVPGGTDRLTVALSSPGPHEVAVEVTDSEGLKAQARETREYVAPGPFEGKGGAATLGLLTSATALGLGLPLVLAQRRERRSAAAAKGTREALAAVEAEGGTPAVRGREPGKVPFAAASEGAPSSTPRIAVGGSPAALLRTRECPVCHNAVDAEVKDCPYCAGNDRAEAFERQLEAPPYDALDLSEVRALVARARRERHLGRHEVDRELLQQAQATADGLAADAASAREWLPRAEAALAAARAGEASGGERAERAEAYVKLALHMRRARQFGKAMRHARRAVEILEAPPEEAASDAGAPPPSDDGEARVRAEIAAVRDEVRKHEALLDPEAFELVRSAEEYERTAQWAQALEVLSTLREKLARARDAAAGGSAPGENPPPAGPGA